MSRWKVTVRSGSDVSRTGFNTLVEALDAARRETEAITAEAPLRKVSAIRDYGPGSLTRGRVEISGKGLLRPPTAGVDIRGDNTLVGYTGSVRRRALRPDDLDGIFRELDRALADD